LMDMGDGRGAFGGHVRACAGRWGAGESRWLRPRAPRTCPAALDESLWESDRGDVGEFPGACMAMSAAEGWQAGASQPWMTQAPASTGGSRAAERCSAGEGELGQDVLLGMWEVRAVGSSRYLTCPETGMARR
jgi:hypothetical protein